MDKCCRLCKFYAELKKPFPVSDGAYIYGYCFKDGTKPYSPCLGKGYPVYINEGDCKAFKRCRKEVEGTVKDSEQNEKNCKQCKYYSELKKPFPLSDDGFIYGYCFIDATNSPYPEGYPVYIDGGACKAFKSVNHSVKDGE